MMNEELKFVT